MIARICLGAFLALGMMTSSSEARSNCSTTPFKECKGKQAYACGLTAVKVGGAHICMKKCYKDMTGGFGPC
jgi:hypothetical protein